jgi:hypothetical protein
MVDREQDDGLLDTSSSSSDEGLCFTETPTRKNLPSTVVIKTRRKQRKERAKTRTEKNWVQAYFNVTLLENEWINPALKHKEPIRNRLWTCKLCGPSFTSTDKERHGNTSRLNNHLRIEYDMTKEKHLLKHLPKVKNGQVPHGGMDQFVRVPYHPFLVLRQFFDSLL